MRSKQFFNPACILVTTIIILIAGMTIYACNKSSGYGGGNNGGSNGDNLSIKNFAFSVSSFSVNKGATVTWTNNDATAHTVTADDSSFDSGPILSGQTYSRTFNTVGTFPYHCSYHSTMTASIVVK